mmetsp:Transcript_22361/g.31316  ORF Transcript_22361/g.31316 Transcript_22361/m.31316 type:complete len:188 (+) Transcript_22361:1159-1722(+)
MGKFDELQMIGETRCIQKMDFHEQARSHAKHSKSGGKHDPEKAAHQRQQRQVTVVLHSLVELEMFGSRPLQGHSHGMSTYLALASLTCELRLLYHLEWERAKKRPAHEASRISNLERKLLVYVPEIEEFPVDSVAVVSAAVADVAVLAFVLAAVAADRVREHPVVLMDGLHSERLKNQIPVNASHKI